jgi:hypothetical protein
LDNQLIFFNSLINSFTNIYLKISRKKHFLKIFQKKFGMYYFIYLYLQPLKFKSNFAKIAQLVERNLAKVEVAGSNPVFRSNFKTLYNAWVVELVDTLDLKSSDCNGRTGSSPVPSTKP